MRKATSASLIASLVLALAAAWLSLAPQDGREPELTQDKVAEKAGKPEQTQSRLPSGHGFERYILALSWSPSWCAENDPDGGDAQCDSRRAYGFIVHGLWPDSDGERLEFCPSREPDRVPDSIVKRHFDIMPSAGLMGHQWRKHGTCSGLDQRAYFDTVAAAFARIKIPEPLERGDRGSRMSPQSVEAAFLKANPALKPGAIGVTCGSGRIEEVRICFSPTLDIIACREVESGACRAGSIEIPKIN